MVRRRSKTEGFSLLELVAALVVLMLLASLGIPSVLKWIKLSRIDESKSLMNSAAAECLQALRSGSTLSNTAPSEITISNDRLNPIGYRVKTTDKSCSSYFIEPSDSQETLLYTMGFKIDPNGRVIKIAIPARDSSSLNSCKAWAGTNCGVSPEQQAEWDRQAALAKAKQECNDSFYTSLSNKYSGQLKRWDDTSNSCTMTTWAFEGTIQSNEEAFKAAREAKLGKICTQRLQEKQTSGFDGLFSDSECGIKTYFFRGTDLNTDDKTIYDAKVREYQQQQCAAAEATWIQSAAKGAFTSPSGLSCTAKWKCNSTIYTDQASYNASTCAAPPPAQPPVSPSLPTTRRCLMWLKGVCKAWV